MKEQEFGCSRGAGLPVKDLEAVNVTGAIVESRYGFVPR
jgi:hypothetical protein